MLHCMSYGVNVVEEVVVLVRPVLPRHTDNQFWHLVSNERRHVDMTCDKQLIDSWANHVSTFGMSTTAIMTNKVLSQTHTHTYITKKLWRTTNCQQRCYWYQLGTWQTCLMFLNHHNSQVTDDETPQAVTAMHAFITAGREVVFM